jgi:hypothetical protein
MAVLPLDKLFVPLGTLFVDVPPVCGLDLQPIRSAAASVGRVGLLPDDAFEAQAIGSAKSRPPFSPMCWGNKSASFVAVLS